MGKRDAIWPVDSKSAREKKNIAGENSYIFGRETVFAVKKVTKIGRETQTLQCIRNESPIVVRTWGLLLENGDILEWCNSL